MQREHIGIRKGGQGGRRRREVVTQARKLSGRHPERVAWIFHAQFAQTLSQVCLGLMLLCHLQPLRTLPLFCCPAPTSSPLLLPYLPFFVSCCILCFMFQLWRCAFSATQAYEETRKAIRTARGRKRRGNRGGGDNKVSRESEGYGAAHARACADIFDPSAFLTLPPILHLHAHTNAHTCTHPMLCAALRPCGRRVGSAKVGLTTEMKAAVTGTATTLMMMMMTFNTHQARCETLFVD